MNNPHNSLMLDFGPHKSSPSQGTGRSHQIRSGRQRNPPVTFSSTTSTLSMPPFNMLPNEILLIIFSFSPNETASNQMLKYAHLSWVCKRWRYLILNTPTFWSKLDLNCKDYGLLRTIFQRSKNAGLSVVVGGPAFPNYDDMNQQIVALESLVFPYMDRVHSLSLKLSYLRYKEIYIPLRRSAPVLKHLHLYRAEEEIIPWTPSYHQMGYHRSKDINFDNLFDNACSLESLTFDMPQPVPWSTFEPMISNIKELTLRTVLWDSSRGCLMYTSLLAILDHCPCLESLELKTIPDRSNDDIKLISSSPIPPLVNLPRLSKLILGTSQDVTLLSQITFPKLHILQLHFDRAYPTSSIAFMTKLVNSFDFQSLHSAVIVDGRNILAYPAVVPMNDLFELIGTTLRFKPGMSTLAITSEPAGGAASALIAPSLAAMISLERLVTFSSETIRNSSSTTMSRIQQFSLSDVDMKLPENIFERPTTSRRRQSQSFLWPFPSLFPDFNFHICPRLRSIINLP